MRRIIYSELDKMIEKAEDPETKIMLLEKMNEFLREDDENNKKI